ncbi:MAG: septum site-determining protein MinC [Deferrisomatales bacterium]
MDRHAAPLRVSIDGSPFTLKGTMLTVTVMHLHRWEAERVRRDLLDTVGQAPELFRRAPVVVDLAALDAGGEVPDFAGLAGALREAGLVPVGVRNGAEPVLAAAEAAGFARLPEAGGSPSRPASAPPKRAREAPANRLVNQPVRSGQQVYAPGGDLIVVAPVSHGAELVADGNIHVYGPLRGRALAGARGDRQARIFCQSLEAQLLSVAGYYRLVDEAEQEAHRGHPVQAYLSGERLEIEPVTR